jgi:hypothetical protein
MDHTPVSGGSYVHSANIPNQKELPMRTIAITITAVTVAIVVSVQSVNAIADKAEKRALQKEADIRLMAFVRGYTPFVDEEDISIGSEEVVNKVFNKLD